MGKRLEAALKVKPLLQKGAQSLSDTEALEIKEIYAEWETGVSVKVHEKQLYGGKLYRCLTAHTTQADWPPDASVSLWAVINESHAGTIDDPIPYNGNMALVEGLCYAQDGVTYYCWRSTGIPVYNTLAELVGLYVEVAEIESNKSSSGLLTEE